MNPILLVGIGVVAYLLFSGNNTGSKTKYTTQTFKAALLPIVQSVASVYDYPVEFIITHASLESDNGNSQLTQMANNLFGFTADASYPSKVLMSTREYTGTGKWIVQNRLFRRYETWEQSVIDYIRLIMSADRYHDVRAKAANGDMVGWANALGASGYATDPKYAAELIARYNSMKWS